MTAAFSRHLTAGVVCLLLTSPALALDPNFGDEPDESAGTTTHGLAADHWSTEQFSTNDDPLTYNALRRITLKQLNINATASQPDAIKDPFQPLNRKIFKFNNRLDAHILRPVAKAYKSHVPSPVRTGVSNFFSNLQEPWDAVNHLLQGKPKSSYKNLGRFTINTLTSAGLADPASRLGLDKQPEDFGLTLGKWGVRSGPFIMLPGLGPSTLRDGTGRIFDWYGRPQHYMDKDKWYWTAGALEVTSLRASFLGVEDLVQGDQYALLRDLYLQRRQYLIVGNQTDDQLDSSFGDEDDGFGDEAPTREQEQLSLPSENNAPADTTPAADPDRDEADGFESDGENPGSINSDSAGFSDISLGSTGLGDHSLNAPDPDNTAGRSAANDEAAGKDLTDSNFKANTSVAQSEADPSPIQPQTADMVPDAPKVSILSANSNEI